MQNLNLTDHIIDFTNTPIALSPKERKAFCILRADFSLGLPGIDTRTLYQGQPLCITNNYLIGYDIPQTLMNKVSVASSGLAGLIAEDWSNSIAKASLDLPAFLNSMSDAEKELLADADKALTQAIKAMFVTFAVAAICIRRLASDVTTDINASDCAAAKRRRAAMTVKLNFSSNFLQLSLGSLLKPFLEKNQLFTSENLKVALMDSRNKFFLDMREFGSVISHCPMHAKISRLINLGEASPLMKVHEAATALLSLLPGSNAPQCPFNHPAKKLTESLVPKG